MSKKYSALYISDMITAINSIFEYTENYSYDQFRKDKKTIDAVIRNLEILGEAAGKVHFTIKKSNYQIPWRLIKDMRNKLIHDYFGVDHSMIFKTIKEDLPVLLTQLQEIMTFNFPED